LQCLNQIQDLRQALETYSPPPQTQNVDAVLTSQLGTVMQQLKSTTDSIMPLGFLKVLQQRFPNFAEMRNGSFMQQDADECLRGILTVLSGTLTHESGSSLVDQLFGFRLKSTLKCLECDEEPPTESEELQRVMLCHLGTQTEPVSHIHQGVSLSLKEHIEKSSPVLGRSAEYEKTSAIASMPPYLLVQFARFGFQAANDWAGTSANKVKLIRKCAFSSSFDVFDLAEASLKKELSKGRLKKKELDDAEVERQRKALSAASVDDQDGGEAQTKPVEDTGMESLESYDTGYYELIAIISHKGRTADGGHYVAWSKYKRADGKELKEDQWVHYNDDEVSFESWNNMVGLATDLQGGKADTQIAYLNIYKKVSVKGIGQALGSAELAAADA